MVLCGRSFQSGQAVASISLHRPIAALPPVCLPTHADGIVDGVVSGAVLGLVWRGAVVLADKTGLKEQVEKARDKLRKN